MKNYAEKITTEPLMLPENKYSPLKPTIDPVKEAEDNFALHALKDEQPAEAKKKIPLIKRFSPFLMLVCILMVIFPYMMITGTGNIKSFWLLLFLFPFTISNLLFADIAIWKYFSGKKIIPIWLIELTLSIVIVQLLV